MSVTNDYRALEEHFNGASPLIPAIPLANHAFLAAVFLSVAALFVFLNVLVPKDSKRGLGAVLANVQYVLYSVIASVSFGVGVIFLSNAVGVYA